MLVSDEQRASFQYGWFCLNPCFSGCWSRTGYGALPGGYLLVLILVLVDVGLGQSGAKRLQTAMHAVLILVLVDVGLGQKPKNWKVII